MPKEKSFNPVQAAKKAEKQKQLKKQKAQLQTQRTEKLARRNPIRLQRDIDELKALEQSGDIRPHDRQRLAQLEKDVVAIKKARDSLGDKAPTFRERRDDDGSNRGRGGFRGRGRGSVLGKRGRDGHWKGEDSSDTDEDVKDIPMPRDTPPPIPHKPRRRHGQNTNDAPPEPEKAQTVYEAAPQIRDLKKEAVRFMPAAVQNKMRLVKGENGRLIEPEELEKLEKEGYRDAEKIAEVTEQEAVHNAMAHGEHSVDYYLNAAGAEMEEELAGSSKMGGAVRDAERAVDAAEEEAEHEMMVEDARGNMHDEGAVSEKVLRHVEIEEVEDEDL